MHRQAAPWGYVSSIFFNKSSVILKMNQNRLTHKQPGFPHYEHIICGLLIFLPLTYFYVLSLPAQGVVENRPPLSGSLERLLKAGERLEGGENLSLWPIKCPWPSATFSWDWHGSLPVSKVNVGSPGPGCKGSPSPFRLLSVGPLQMLDPLFSYCLI